MKVRNGFVSNSSSSSFVIGVGKPFNTALQVASHMIPFREWDSDQELVSKIRKIREGRQKEINAVCFKSCNYDTFIAKMGDVFLIETCHNHNWDLDQWRVSCPEEYYDYFGDDSFYNLSYCIDFLHLEYDVIGRPIPYRERRGFDYECGSCGAWDHWLISEEIKCPKCGAPPTKQKKN